MWLGNISPHRVGISPYVAGEYFTSWRSSYVTGKYFTTRKEVVPFVAEEY
jgi:hypothetical protein